VLLLSLFLVFIIVAAIVAIEIKDLLAATIAVGAVGFAVAIMFILTQAPDLAIVQIVVEVLTVIIFVAVVLQTTHDDTTVGLNRGMIFPLVSYLAFGFVFIALVLYTFNELPKFGEPIMKVAQFYIDQGLAKTGAANIVAAVILDFRGYDTLGEATVLFTAVLGVLTVLRRIGRK